jgi:hypothetical protein
MSQLEKIPPSPQWEVRPVPTTEPTVPAPRQGSVVEGSLWMVGLTIALFFLPLVNGLIGGFVGGYKVGSTKRALASALLPAFVVSVGLWILLMLFNLPVVGLFAGAVAGVAILLADIGILIGAVIGGSLSSRRSLTGG